MTLALILVLVFLGAVAQGAVGVGLGLVATPFVAALEPALVPGPMLMIMVFAAAVTAWRERAAADYRWATAALLGRVPGVLLGAWVFALVSMRVYAWIFALAVLAGVAASVFAPRIPPRLGTLAAGGFGAGFMGTLTSIGGPPIILALQHGQPQTVRATLSLFFAVGSLMSVLALIAFGQFGWRELYLGLAITPPMALGIVLSRYVKGRVNQRTMRPLLLGMAAAAAPLLLFRAIAAG